MSQSMPPPRFSVADRKIRRCCAASDPGELWWWCRVCSAVCNDLPCSGFHWRQAGGHWYDRRRRYSSAYYISIPTAVSQGPVVHRSCVPVKWVDAPCNIKFLCIWPKHWKLVAVTFIIRNVCASPTSLVGCVFISEIGLVSVTICWGGMPLRQG